MLLPNYIPPNTNYKTVPYYTFPSPPLYNKTHEIFNYPSVKCINASPCPEGYKIFNMNHTIPNKNIINSTLPTQNKNDFKECKPLLLSSCLKPCLKVDNVGNGYSSNVPYCQEKIKETEKDQIGEIEYVVKSYPFGSSSTISSSYTYCAPYASVASHSSNTENISEMYKTYAIHPYNISQNVYSSYPECTEYKKQEEVKKIKENPTLLVNVEVKDRKVENLIKRSENGKHCDENLKSILKENNNIKKKNFNEPLKQSSPCNDDKKENKNINPKLSYLQSDNDDTNNCMKKVLQELNKLKEEKAFIEKQLYNKNALLQRLKLKYPEDHDMEEIIVTDMNEMVQNLQEDKQKMCLRVEALIKEKDDLEKILLERDRQIFALSNIDTSKGKELSAMQLGIQAITLVERSANLRDKILCLEASIQSLKEQKKILIDKNNDLEKKLKDKGLENSNLVEKIAARDMNIAAMETIMYQKDIDFSNCKDEFREALNKAKAELYKNQSEVSIQLAHNEKLRDELGNRDNEILVLEGEIIRKNTAIKELEDNMAKLNSNLELTQTDLKNLINSSIKKDIYMRDLEEQLKENEVKRQASYMTEMFKSRKMIADIQEREDNCVSCLKNKEDIIESLKNENQCSKNQLDMLKDAFRNTIENNFSCQKKNKRLNKFLNSNSLTSFQNVNKEIDNDSEKDYLYKTKEAFSYLMNTNDNCHSTTSRPEVFYVYDSSSFSSSSGDNENILSEAKINNKVLKTNINLLSNEYIPVDGDAIDEALAQFFKKQINYTMNIRNKFQRISHGNYLFGEKKVKLRLDFDNFIQGQIKPDISEWLPLNVFIEKMEDEVQNEKAKKQYLQ